MRFLWIAFAMCMLACSASQAADSGQGKGRYLASTCANCHGTDGKSVGSVPSLAGQSAENILTKLAEFKEGTRPATIMHQIAKGYTDDQLKLVADYFAGQK